VTIALGATGVGTASAGGASTGGRAPAESCCAAGALVAEGGGAVVRRGFPVTLRAFRARTGVGVGAFRGGEEGVDAGGGVGCAQHGQQ
jgi:hypothetical protein